MHVGFVVYGGLDRTSGGYRYDRKLVEYLRSKGDDVSVIALPWRSYPGNLATTVSRAVRRRLNRPFDVLLQDQLCHPSLVAHNRHLDAPDAIVTLVHLLRSPDPQYRLTPLYRAVERRYLASVDGAICTSAFTRDRTRDLATVPTRIAYPGGRSEARGLPRAQVKERASRDEFRVLFVGNLTARKGADTVLEALESLGGNWTATFIGAEADSEYVSSLRRRTREAGVADRVTFTGEVPAGRLEEAFRAAHVLAVPSRYEGFGMVYLEAMEYGVVPVAGSVGGASEFVADGRNGAIVDPEDPEMLADRLSELQADRLELRRRALAAQSTAAAHPDWAESMATARQFLVECANGGGPQRVSERSVQTVGGGST